MNGEFRQIQSLSIASGATMTTYAMVNGCETLNIRIPTQATASIYAVLGSETYTSASFLPVFTNSPASGVVALVTPSSVQGAIYQLNIGQGLKYVVLQSNTVLVDGSGKIEVNAIK